MSELSDTSPEIASLVRSRLRAFSGAERFVMGALMFDAARAMVLAALPGDLSEDEKRRRLYERFYGEDLPVDFRAARSP
jgi:hypothetical protein